MVREKAFGRYLTRSKVFLRHTLLPHTPWLLDHWHIAQAVRAFTGADQGEFRRLMRPVWNADSEAALALKDRETKSKM